MLAPIREYLRPHDPLSSPLLCTTKYHYSNRLSLPIRPNEPGFYEARWILSEDVNVEYLLDVFTSADQPQGDVWNPCYRFIRHLYWHKPRRTILASKIEGLADDHPSKVVCLFWLSRLFDRGANYVEQKRLLTRALELQRRRGDDLLVAAILRNLSGANNFLLLYEEGIRQAKEALGIYERIGDTRNQARCFSDLTRLLHSSRQLGAAEKTAFRAIELPPKNQPSVNFTGFLV